MHAYVKTRAYVHVAHALDISEYDGTLPKHCLYDSPARRSRGSGGMSDRAAGRGRRIDFGGQRQC